MIELLVHEIETGELSADPTLPPEVLADPSGFLSPAAVAGNKLVAPRLAISNAAAVFESIASGSGALGAEYEFDVPPPTSEVLWWPELRPFGEYGRDSRLFLYALNSGITERRISVTRRGRRASWADEYAYKIEAVGDLTVAPGSAWWQPLREARSVSWVECPVGRIELAYPDGADALFVAAFRLVSPVEHLRDREAATVDLLHLSSPRRGEGANAIVVNSEVRALRYSNWPD